MKERDDARSRVTKLEDELDQAKGRIKELEKDLDKSREKVPTRPPEAQIAAAYSELRLTKGGRLRAVFDTNQGEITCELFPHIAPMTVLNFVGLAEGTKEWVDPTSGMKTTQPLYDGTKFHRVIKGFMIQGGDPLGTGRGGPGYMFGDEVWPDIRFDRAGVLAMANAGPGTNGSQFFITSSPQTHLNGKHTIFGKCDTETVERVMALPTGGESGSAPVDDVVVKTLKIERLPPAE
ncbi:MAG: peptidylprolyl isomerase [Alphaproteobacteria bacterium]|nr:peptidylprolyl isomerase [Alphaproteobacteria bacterium]